MSDKKFTPREAAMAVLAKAQELYSTSSLAKKEAVSKGSPTKTNTETGGSSPGGASTGGVGSNPDAKADSALGEKVEQEVKEHESQNEDGMKSYIKLAKFMGRMEHKKGEKAKALAKAAPASAQAAPVAPAATPAAAIPAAAPMAAPAQAAPMVKGETGHEEGINREMGAKGQSLQGAAVRVGNRAPTQFNPTKKIAVEAARGIARDKLTQMQAQPKPKLPG